MLLTELMKAVDYSEVINRTGIDPSTVDVLSLCSDSRTVSANSMFVCISGSINDGHDYVWGAYGRMCRIFVIEHAIKIKLLQGT